MSADAPVTLAWLGPERPDAEQSRGLEAWARAHGVQLVLPQEDAPRRLAVDPRSSEEVEKLLDRVRDAIAARDGEAADAGLAAAEGAVRAHPEAPQASWLMAEVERARSSRLRRIGPIDEEAADRAWMRAEALDGGRAAGVGERAANAHPPEATLHLDALPAGAEVRIDGHPQPAPGGTLATRAGPHALVIASGQTPVWARWVEAPAGSSTVQVTLPAPAACSAGDLALARLTSDAVDGERVRCGAWMAALPGTKPASLRVAVCDPGRCGALLEWSAPAPGAFAWTPPPAHHGHWPSWATWGLVGAGAVVVTGLVVVATGALQSSAAETRFASGGVRTQ